MDGNRRGRGGTGLLGGNVGWLEVWLTLRGKTRTFVLARVLLTSHELVVHVRRQLLELLLRQPRQFLSCRRPRVRRGCKMKNKRVSLSDRGHRIRYLKHEKRRALTSSEVHGKVSAELVIVCARDDAGVEGGHGGCVLVDGPIRICAVARNPGEGRRGWGGRPLVRPFHLTDEGNGSGSGSYGLEEEFRPATKRKKGWLGHNVATARVLQ